MAELKRSSSAAPAYRHSQGESAVQLLQKEQWGGPGAGDLRGSSSASPEKRREAAADGSGGRTTQQRRSLSADNVSKLREYVDIWEFINNDADGTESVASTPSGASSVRGGGRQTRRPYEGGFSISADAFEEPCVPVAMSGGTAAFYRVRYKAGREPVGAHGVEHYVGKDLAHATDEIGFYGKLREIINRDPTWGFFGEMAMECPGVAKLKCKNPKDPSKDHERDVLLLENLRNGFDQLRLLDVKMGSETSAPNWKGKSRLHHWKNARVDVRTNSLTEGFRLEGMELPPRSLQERIEAVGGGSSGSMRARVFGIKAAKRFTMQRLRATDFLAAWLDVGALGAGAELHAHGALWSAYTGVGQLLLALLDLPTPQQWIGSSLAMGMEIGKLSKDPRIVLKVFDWGRAELTDVDDYRALSIAERQDRIRYWKHYVRAVARLYWELSRISAHRCCCRAWTAFIFELRSEPLSVVRAFAVGQASGEVRGLAIYQLPVRGSRSTGSANLALPLIGSGAGGPAARAIFGVLHVRVSWPADAGAGEGSLIVDVQGATQLPADIDDYGASVNVIRVIGFERAGDARLHMEAWRGGSVEPQPRGRAYAHTTPPGGITAGTMVWESQVEFFGLGHQAASEAQVRLNDGIPAGFGESVRGDVWPPGRFSEARSPSQASGATPWPELLPPALGNEAHLEATARVFSNQFAPWLDDDAANPPSWA